VLVVRARPIILSVISLVWATTVHAGTVAIVRPSTATRDFAETLSRLHGEMLSVGLEVRLIDRAAERDPDEAATRAWVEELAVEGDVDAVIEIVGDAAPVAVEVWVIEPSPRRLELSRVALDPGTRNPAERLAILAVEVLRSTFLEQEMVARERPEPPAATPAAAPPPPVEPAAPEEPPSRGERFAVEAGAAALIGLDGVGPALMPLGCLAYSARPWFVVQASAAGLGTRPTVATNAGHARVAQQLGILGVGYRFGPERQFWPFVVLSTGALRTAVEGSAAAPAQGHAAEQWSLLLDGSLGAGLRLSERFYGTLAAHAQVAEPYVAIHFADELVATSGRPNLAVTMTVGGRP